jgi:hypothetical protein
MFSAFWRQRRAWAIETRIMNGAIATQPADQDELTRLTAGFTSIAAQPPLELMHRYETRLHRIFQRALANLILMRSLQELTPPAENTHSPVRAPNVREGSSEATQPPPPAENIKLPNDPSPISGHSPAPEPPAGNTHSPIRAPNVREGSCEATQPPPPAENIELPNDPSPISGHLSAPESEGDLPKRARDSSGFPNSEF